jgi:hypothetical protein
MNPKYRELEFDNPKYALYELGLIIKGTLVYLKSFWICPKALRMQ